PERRQTERAGRRLVRTPFIDRLSREEMSIGQIQEISSAEELHPADLDQIDGQQGGNSSKDEGTEDAVAQGFLLLRIRQAEDEHGQHHRVVRAEEPFERDEQRDGGKVRRLEHRPRILLPKLTRVVSSRILGSLQGS